MKKTILILVSMLVVFTLPVYAKTWSTSDTGDLCVSGEGDYTVVGQGSLYLSGAGVMRFDRNTPVTSMGDWDVIYKGSYVYYSGAGDIWVDQFDGELRSIGGGSGYIELHGIGWVSLRGSAREMNVGCIWE